METFCNAYFITITMIQESKDFEKLIRMATDNKINASNSWNLALIDYFHELTFLKEGGRINFQKASATLDGCIKIYSSRVDSASTETGRLLSGLTNRNPNVALNIRNGKNEMENRENADTFESNENRAQGRKARRMRNLDCTLADFDTQIKMKKLDSELVIEPLFGELLSEFDEGGSKNLLMNLLNTGQGARLVFTSLDKTTKHNELVENCQANKFGTDREFIEVLSFRSDNIEQLNDNFDFPSVNSEQRSEPTNEDVMDLRFEFFNDLDNFKSLQLCSSLSQLRHVISGQQTATALLENLNTVERASAFLMSSPLTAQHLEDNSLEGDDYSVINSSSQPDKNIINRELLPEEEIAVHETSITGEDDGFTPVIGDYCQDVFEDITGTSLRNFLSDLPSYRNTESHQRIDKTHVKIGLPDKYVLSYFDTAVRKFWAGPTHWKVQNLRNFQPFNSIVENNPGKEHNDVSQEASQLHGEDNANARKDKTFKSVDFLSTEFLDELEIFKEGSNSNLYMTKAERQSQDHYLLPDDKHVDTKNFIRLFLKKQIINVPVLRTEQHLKRSEVSTNEDFIISRNSTTQNLDRAEEEDFYDNFGPQEDNFDDLLQSPLFQNPKTPAMSEALKFSKIARKVDVKALKDNLWEVLRGEMCESGYDEDLKSSELLETIKNPPNGLLRNQEQQAYSKTYALSRIVRNLDKRYISKVQKDISTGFYFICMLHLASEHGLVLKSNTDYTDLTITEPSL